MLGLAIATCRPAQSVAAIAARVFVLDRAPKGRDHG